MENNLVERPGKINNTTKTMILDTAWLILVCFLRAFVFDMQARAVKTAGPMVNKQHTGNIK